MRENYNASRDVEQADVDMGAEYSSFNCAADERAMHARDNVCIRNITRVKGR